MKKLIAVILVALFALAACACAEGTTFKMGIDAEYPPYTYMGDDGNYTGYDVEMCQKVCEILGWNLEIVPINWDTKLIQLDANEIDCIWSGLTIVLAFTAGASFVMWMGEQISEHGVGNGISMILFANIVSGLPSILSTLLGITWWVALIMAVMLFALIIFIIFINDAERRIPVQYAKRVVGRKIYGGQNTNLPIKVSMSGVMPVIFAQSICSVPATICAFMGINAQSGNWWYDNVFASSSVTYMVIYGLLIFFFSWFYSQIQYDPVEVSNNLKKNGGFIPGFRPGKPTADFIKKVIGKIVVFGAVYLTVVALLPMIAGSASGTNLAIGGTSIIIIVGVALETVKAIEAQMLMRHYKGFLD